MNAVSLAFPLRAKNRFTPQRARTMTSGTDFSSFLPEQKTAAGKPYKS
jgi:hypothetical protein